MLENHSGLFFCSPDSRKSRNIPFENKNTKRNDLEGFGMRRIVYLLLLCIFFIGLTGFDNQDKLKISKAEITIIKSEDILRYDFKIKNTGKSPVKSEFDYPGHHLYGIEMVVRPSEKLASFMMMVEDTKYKKMVPMGGGNSGQIDPGNEGSFHAEYKIKEGADLDKVRKHAFDSTVLILDGLNITAEFPLKGIKSTP